METGAIRNATRNGWTIPLIVLATLVGAVVVVSLAAILVLATGSLSVAADEKPGLIERTLAPWGRDRSVHQHAPQVKNPYDGDPDATAEGLDHYRENCLVCHGAPGVPISELAKGLNPPAPSLGKEEIDTPDGELFWVTKHGIRLTSMPAFGWTHSDEEIWKIVTFIRHLPELTAEEKEFLREGAGTEEAHQEQHLKEFYPQVHSGERSGHPERARDGRHHESRP